MTPDLTPVRGLLHAVRARLRRTLLLRAAGLVWAAVCVAAVVSFALDYALDMPVPVRAVHLILAIVVLGVFAAAMLRPLRRSPSDAELASAIEHDVPDLEDRLASALDFERRMADPAEPESREMMATAVREASSHASRLDGALLVDGRPARRALVGALLASLLVMAVEGTFADEFALWLRRGLLLEDATWPRRTNIVVEGFPAEGPLVVTRGDDVRIVARAEGSQPADVDLHLEELAEAAEGEEPAVSYRDVRKMFPVPDQPGKYAFDFRAVSASFRFWVTGGDDLDQRPMHEVRALVPPRIASAAADVEYPAYTGLAPATVTEPVFDALAGSKVTFRFTANLPLASARFVPTEGAAQDLAIGADGRTFTTSLTLAKTVEFHVELHAKLGHTNRNEDDVFRVNAVADRAPTVRMLWPRGRLVTTPTARVPLKAVVEDDFGLAAATLDLRRNDAAAEASVWTAPAPGPAPVPGSPAAAGDAGPTRHLHLYRAFDVAESGGEGAAPPKAGDALTLAFHAKDSGGADTQGPEASVEIVSPEEMAQRLTSESGRLRDDLLQIRRAQRRTVASLRELSTAAGATPDSAALRRGRDLQVDQGRALGDAARFTAGIRGVFDAQVLCRLGSGPTVERLLPLYDEFLSREPDDSGEVFPSALYERIVEDKRARRLYDPEILGVLMDVLDLSDRLRTTEGPAVYDALDAWSADGPHAPDVLDAAVRAAEQVLATLDAIDERLQRFEDLAAIVQLARSIRAAQDDLTRRPDAPNAKPETPENK